MNSCAILGLHPDEMFFKYNESHPLCIKIKSLISEQIKNFCKHGIRRFYIAGDRGASMWAGEIVAEMKGSSDYPDIELICVIPFKSCCSECDDADHERFDRILSVSDTVEHINSSNDRSAAKKCYRYTIDNSGYLVAVYNEKVKQRSGVGAAVRYAKKRGKAIVVIHPETAAITLYNAE